MGVGVGGGEAPGPRKPILLQTGSPAPQEESQALCVTSAQALHILGLFFLPSKPGEGMVWSHGRPSDLSSYKYHSRRLSARKPTRGTRLACQSACHSEH